MRMMFAAVEVAAKVLLACLATKLLTEICCLDETRKSAGLALACRPVGNTAHRSTPGSDQSPARISRPISTRNRKFESSSLQRRVMCEPKKFWPRIASLGRLSTEIAPHVLRHSIASLAADLGYSEPTITALVWHKGHSTTSRYLHAADAVLLAAADMVARRTAELMDEH
jgi:hypothetical protein